jgi:predicted DNA-binding protein with PD1-like motif/rhodanese-related sulfurtransferase
VQPDAGLVSLALRLVPGDDLRQCLEAAVAKRGLEAGFVLAGIGSLRPTQIRLAGATSSLCLDEDAELLTLSGSVGCSSSHLHLSVSLRSGQVVGGHAGYGCTVRTTAEVLLALLPSARFSRLPDARTGYDELVVDERPSDAAGASAPALPTVAGVSPTQARQLVAQGASWVDVREAEELEAFDALPGAQHLPRAAWVGRADAVLHDRNQALVVYCGRGDRGTAAALSLLQQGYTNVVNVRGGLQALLLDDPASSS